MDDLDAAVALVYAQPPAGFVGARSALVRELKAAKRKEDAARVAALRRPTKLAWALGQAVRSAPEAAAAFFAAVAALADPDDLRRRTAELRGAVSDLVAAVEGVDPGDATAAFLGVAADPEATTALRLGRLAEIPAAGGFGGLGLGGGEPTPDDAGAPASAAAPTEPTEPDRAGDTLDEGAEAAAQREREEREERARAERLAALEVERAEAGAAELAAVQEVEAAEVALEAAEARLAGARRELERARATLAAVDDRSGDEG